MLVGSLKYQAIKLDKLSRTLLENIALADLGYAVTWVLPTLTSIISDRWVLFHSFATLLSHVNIAPLQSYYHMLTMLSCKVIITC